MDMMLVLKLFSYLFVIQTVLAMSPKLRLEQSKMEVEPSLDDLSTMSVPICRVFVDASPTTNRFILIHSTSEGQDNVRMLNQFPSILPPLTHMSPMESYSILRPGLMNIAMYLREQERLQTELHPPPLKPPASIEPRHCHVHLVVTFDLITTSDDMIKTRTRQDFDFLFDQIYEKSIDDAQFPFLFAREDMNVVSREWKLYYQLMSSNYLDGRISHSLGPGTVELGGIVAIDHDGLSIGFDLLERWKRGLRRKHIHQPLNMTDFYVKVEVNYAQDPLYIAVNKILYDQQIQHKKDVDGSTSIILHPCLVRGYHQIVAIPGTAGGGEVQGIGDATECIQQLQTFISNTNIHCPSESYCLVNSVAQPQPVGPFFTTGVVFQAIEQAKNILQLRSDPDKTSVDELIEQLHVPTLNTLRTVANRICQVSWSWLEEVNLHSERICFELCQIIVLLQQLGIEEQDKRVVIGLPTTNANTTITNALPTTEKYEEESTWLIGMFLYVNVVQAQKEFSMEANTFAQQIREGVPVAEQLALFLCVVVWIVLYYTTGARPRYTKSNRSSGVVYSRLNDGKARRMTTNAIQFLHDVSE